MPISIPPSLLNGRIDRLAIALSGMCVAHCLATAVLLGVLASAGGIFAATGVTDGSLLGGVKRLPGSKLTTDSVVMRASTGTVRWVKGEHHLDRKHV